jgi:predicted O-methyltransferase YrrM
MNSSYNNKNISYKDVFRLIIKLNNPKNIVEFGILDGYSLSLFSEDKECSVIAYDIFDEFKGNYGPYNELKEKFQNFKNVSINYGDFYKKFSELENQTIDLLHVDIANNGDVYNFCKENYFEKVKKGGIIILEGGSEERDNVEWMNRYDKPKIKHIIDDWKTEGINVMTIGTIPSLTVVKK